MSFQTEAEFDWDLLSRFAAGYCWPSLQYENIGLRKSVESHLSDIQLKAVSPPQVSKTLAIITHSRINNSAHCLFVFKGLKYVFCTTRCSYWF